MNAPVILFVYSRLEHTKETINELKKNHLAQETDLIIYSDCYKNDSDKKAVQSVRCYLETLKNGFKSVEIITRTENFGLAKNIMEGVSEVTKKHGRAIVLEDDIVTSPFFLTYMNEALEKYKNNKKIWHISGWNYPISDSELPDAFFWRTMNCWGWATWDDRWSEFSKEPQKLIDTWSKDDIYKFNVDGANNFWSQVIANNKGTLNTWAIFWYATIFKNNGLCLNPTVSLVLNIGNDGSGENCTDNDLYKVELFLDTLILPNDININSQAVDRIKKFYKKSKLPIYKKIINKIKRKFK
ncbi:glycosyltransferase [Photobacterium carnosum]|uniref:glycosyltransferase n=1 Tax=Photobacterium carnosum TaxID=2023717 RepID=UPI001E447E34|nr:glycosyltransferase [Photobacterium carnosum]MCD9513346.1 glycosyltransferase [Photobacterium carnosum]